MTKIELVINIITFIIIVGMFIFVFIMLFLDRKKENAIKRNKQKMLKESEKYE